MLLPAEPPLWGPAHDKLGFRARVKAWNDSIVGDLNAFPYIVFVFYALKIFVYIWIFQTYVCNPDVGPFEEDNLKRRIVYNIFGDVLGLNSTVSPTFAV